MQIIQLDYVLKLVHLLHKPYLDKMLLMYALNFAQLVVLQIIQVEYVLLNVHNILILMVTHQLIDV